MSGWIKLHRSITNHWLYTEKRKFSKFEAWNDMLLNVNYSDCKTIIKGNLYQVKRGQSILSLDSWAKRWNWDKSSVRRFFNLLEKDEMIVVKSDNVTTHLTICKYEDYQDERNANETQTKRRRNADEIQTTLIEEREERKEEKEVYTHPLQTYIKSNFPNVYKLKTQLTNENCDKLITEFDKNAIVEILEAMDNKKDLTAKYASVNLTLRSWIKQRREKNPSFGEIKKEVVKPLFDNYYGL
jgi:hypothetical protein